jgi:hypothetical protein
MGSEKPDRPVFIWKNLRGRSLYMVTWICDNLLFLEGKVFKLWTEPVIPNFYSLLEERFSELVVRLNLTSPRLIFAVNNIRLW